MISYDDYSGILKKSGKNLAEIRRSNAAKIVNQTFRGDIEYKRVYILDPDEGWHYTDAHYIKHSNVSISKDQVDTYLQFRPYEHHKVGSYVFIPDDTSPDLNIDEDNPLGGDVKNLWMIVGRNDANEFVRYMVLRCNWDFKWVATIGGERKILHCIACTRSANSYTSYKIQLALTGNGIGAVLLNCWEVFRVLQLQRNPEMDKRESIKSVKIR